MGVGGRHAREVLRRERSGWYLEKPVVRSSQGFLLAPSVPKNPELQSKGTTKGSWGGPVFIGNNLSRVRICSPGMQRRP